MHRAKIPLLLFFLSCVTPFAPARAAESLIPYQVRTRPYSGLGSTIRGDIQTVGMAGATVGLADSFIAGCENPAGLAMTLRGATLQITENRIQDGHVQHYDNTIPTTNVGVAANPYPYGVSLGFWSPGSEGQPYLHANGERLVPEIYVREYRMSFARVVARDRLSLGATLIMGRASRSLELPGTPQYDASDSSFAVTLGFGLMYQLPGRVLLGASFIPPLHYPSEMPVNTTRGMVNFFQPVETPFRLAVGPGWLPNRFFRAGFELRIAGASPGAALLGNDTRLVGSGVTVDPRLGATYLVADFRNLKIEVALGTYYEMSRTDGASSRLHGTAGIEINPWVLTFGWGMDQSVKYQNFIYCAGIDVVKFLRRLDLIPQEVRPPYAGFLPNPFHMSDEDLPRPMVRNWRGGKPADIVKVGLGMPGRVEKKLRRAGEKIKRLTPGDVVDAVGDVLEDAVDEGPAMKNLR